MAADGSFRHDFSTVLKNKESGEGYHTFCTLIFGGKDCILLLGLKTIILGCYDEASMDSVLDSVSSLSSLYLTSATGLKSSNWSL